MSVNHSHLGPKLAIAFPRLASVLPIGRHPVDAVLDIDDSRRLSRLANHPSPTIRCAAAANPHTPFDVRRRLAMDVSRDVRSVVAWMAPEPDLLRAMVNDQSAFVRKYLASNEAAPTDVLEALATDGELGVRAVVAQRATDASVLEALASDAELDVRGWLALNPATPPQVLSQVFAQDPHDADLRDHIAVHANLPKDLAQQFVSDADVRARLAVAENPRLSEELVQVLIADPDPQVRLAASLSPHIPVDSAASLLDATDPESLLGDYEWHRQAIIAKIDDSDVQRLASRMKDMPLEEAIATARSMTLPPPTNSRRTGLGL